MHSFLHSSAWQRFQESAGAHCERSLDQLYLERSLPLGFGTYWLSSRCLLSGAFAIPAFAEKSCFLRLEPVDEVSLREIQRLAQEKNLKLASTVAVQPRQTSLVDIAASEEDILMNMKQKHRYNLRLAQKAGLVTEVYSQDLANHFPRFWDLLHSTAQRQGFRPHSPSYYQLMLQELEKEEMAHLIFVRLAEKETDLAAMILITYQNTATYLHGASVQTHKEKMAPYLLHWQAIELAKSKGCTIYDLWGTDAVYHQETQEWVAKTHHPSAGTTRFKLGFGGATVTYPGTYDLILNPFCYTVYATLRALRGQKRAFA